MTVLPPEPVVIALFVLVLFAKLALVVFLVRWQWCRVWEEWRKVLQEIRE